MSRKNTQLELSNNMGVMKPLWALLYLTFGLLIFVAFADYHPEQSPQLSTAANGVIPHPNLVGTLGASLAFWCFRLLGASAWLLPLFTFWLFYLFMFRRAQAVTHWKYLHMALAIVFCTGLMTLWQERFLLHTKAISAVYSCGLGGILGKLLFLGLLEKILGVFGSSLLLIVTSSLFLMLSFAKKKNPNEALENLLSSTGNHLNDAKDFSKSALPALWKRFLGYFKHSTSKQEQENVIIISQEKRKETLLNKKVGTNAKASVQQEFEPLDPKDPLPIIPTPNLKIVEGEEVEKAASPIPQAKGNYQFPPISILKEGDPVSASSGEEHQETAALLIAKLAEFGVEVQVDEVHTGPVITRYEVTPARGVRVEKILNLEKNIALGLKAPSVRILAPVPGKGCVGIELPNKNPLAVCLRDIIESKAWVESTAEIPIVLGKEITGKPLITDLAKMPHLLIAGATGSGKTVCINAIIASLVYHAGPEDLRFIMVDPKIVEMKVYNDLPHMLIPVVTDPKRVPGALKWLIAEMERRYQIFAQVGVRNIAGFNAKIAKEHSEKDSTSAALSPEERQAARELADTADEVEIPNQKLPYIVCIIDELADLMLVAPADIETCVARLAQLARAAGIHLILATQRPSVNVITGVIKANLPSRIAFKVASKVDSRTILDGNGADQLIGRGDMLFIPPGTASMVRAQGALVSDDEINALVDFLKQNGPPQFAQEIQEHIEAASSEDGEDFSAASSDDDPLLQQALEVIRSTQRASTSMLQRRLKIGYNRAARIMEILEKRGYVGPENGAQPREILKDLSL